VLRYSSDSDRSASLILLNGSSNSAVCTVPYSAIGYMYLCVGGLRSLHRTGKPCQLRWVSLGSRTEYL